MRNFDKKTGGTGGSTDRREVIAQSGDGFQGEITQPSAEESTHDGFNLALSERSPQMIVPDIGVFACKPLEDDDSLALEINDLTRRQLLAVLKSSNIFLTNFQPSIILLHPGKNGLRANVKVEGRNWGATNFASVDMSKVLGDKDFDDKMLAVIIDILKAVDRVIEGKGLDEKFNVKAKVIRDPRARTAGFTLQLRPEQHRPK